ncbi:MAG: inositol 2-dehydrogenase [Caldilineaceae bacterium]|nr:inositol 2-dehydrogenase [Caldilineaceae bacterium]
MTGTINVGLIGAGRIGQVHAESITRRTAGARIVAVADVNQAAAEQCAGRFQIGEATGDPHDLLNNPAIEAVLICSSTDTHAPLIRAAAAAGKHIFCEKPIALDLAAIDAALADVAQAGVKLQIGFNRRFDSNFRHLRHTVASGGIGAPHLVRITSRDPAPPPIAYIQVSGGIFLDMTIHDFDLARFLIDDEVTEVYATGAVLVDPAIGAAGDLDTVVVTLRYVHGALGVIDNSRQALYGYDQRAEVFGAAGAVEAQNKTPHNTTHSTADGVQRPKPHYFFLERYMDSYVAEMSAFLDAIRTDVPTPVTGADGRMATVLGLAAWRSVREKRPVAVDEIG